MAWSAIRRCEDRLRLARHHYRATCRRIGKRQAGVKEPYVALAAFFSAVLQESMNKPCGIFEWDWRYRVGFDAALRLAIEGQIQNLPVSKERDQLDRQLEWSVHFVSLGAMIDHAAELNDASNFTAVIGSPSRILHVPAQLNEFYQRKIANSSASPSSKALLNQILEIGLTNQFRNVQAALFEAVFGDDLRDLLNFASSQPRLSMPALKYIEVHEVEEIVFSFEKQLKQDSFCNFLLKKYRYPSFKTTIVSGEGYAEYWPVDLTGKELDELVLYDNSLSMDRNTLVSTLVHEIFPGHGLFYQSARAFNPSFIDHGALGLVEGWATWCEWNILPNDYTAFSRASRLRSLQTLRTQTSDELVATIDSLRSERGEDDDESRNAQLDINFQYPGFSQSYGLGALWMERQLTLHELADFLPSLAERPWGDFFRTWSRSGTI